MELCLQTPDGETTAVEFGADAHVGDVVAAFEKLMPWATGVGTIERFRAHSVDTPLSETGVEDGEEVSASGMSLDDYPSEYHEEVLRQVLHTSLSDLDSKTLSHARLLAESGHPSTFPYKFSSSLTQLGAPIWALGHDTWLSDFVRPHFLSQPRDACFWSHYSHYYGECFWHIHGHAVKRPYLSPDLVAAVLSGEVFPCEPLVNAREELIAEAAEKWGREHELCKVAMLLPTRRLSVISKESAAFADAVWTHKETHAPAPEFVWVPPGPGEDDKWRIPQSHCVSADVPDIRNALFLDVRGISVAVKHGVPLEKMWHTLSAYILKWYSDSTPGPFDASGWLPACWKLLALGLDPETRGARGMRGLHLCVFLNVHEGRLAFLAAGADRANVGTIGPCFMAGKVCASDCACHHYYSGAARLRNLEASENQSADDESNHSYRSRSHRRPGDREECRCDYYFIERVCDRCADRVGTKYTFEDVLPWEEADTRVERSARMHTWKARQRKPRNCKR